MACNNNYTITFDEKVKGWTSFHSFYPDCMIGMNNEFYSFKDGNLHLHHSGSSDRNTYYGVQFPSKIGVLFNDSPSDIKEIQTVSLEGNYAWDSILTAYVDMVDNILSSSIKEEEYVQKEGHWYAYARRNEDATQLDSKSAYGIGRVTVITGTTLIINGGSNLLTVGDSIVDDNLTVIGTITAITTGSGTVDIELDSVSGLSIGDFVIGVKNARIEGGHLRGYTMRVDLEILKEDKVELFAVNSEIFKSYT